MRRSARATTALERQTAGVRVATFNILHGRAPSDGRVDLERLAGAIQSLDADILALQEVDRDQPRSLGADLTAVAAEAMGATAHQFVAAVTGTPGATWQAATGSEQPGTAGYGIALLSRYPVSRWQVVRLPALGAPVPMWHRGRGWSMVRDEARVAVLATVQVPGGSVTVATTHLSFLPAWNVVQLRRVLAFLRPENRPVILMGDLNMDAGQARRITRLTPLAGGPTYPAEAPKRQLVHILARGLGSLTGSAVVALPLSDHQALTADVELA